jgi:hypothetical protein
MKYSIDETKLKGGEREQDREREKRKNICITNFKKKTWRKNLQQHNKNDKNILSLSHSRKKRRGKRNLRRMF